MKAEQVKEMSCSAHVEKDEWEGAEDNFNLYNMYEYILLHYLRFCRWKRGDTKLMNVYGFWLPMAKIKSVFIYV